MEQKQITGIILSSSCGKTASFQEAYLFLCFDFSTVLVWDTRPSKSAAPAHAAGQNPAGTLPTFKHLDLTWKPVLRVVYMLWNFVSFQCRVSLKLSTIQKLFTSCEHDFPCLV